MGTREKGFISYYEICQHIKNGWTAKYHDEHKVMYAYGGDQWIAYDNVATIQIKAQYIKDKGLAGGMIWALDLDDFKGTFCGEGKYPLLKGIVDVLFNGKVPVEPPVGPTDGPIVDPVTDGPQPEPETPKPPTPGELGKCTSAKGGVKQSCAAGLHFNTKTGNCDWPAAAG